MRPRRTHERVQDGDVLQHLGDWEHVLVPHTVAHLPEHLPSSSPGHSRDETPVVPELRAEHLHDPLSTSRGGSTREEQLSDLEQQLPHVGRDRPSPGLDARVRHHHPTHGLHLAGQFTCAAPRPRSGPIRRAAETSRRP